MPHFDLPCDPDLKILFKARGSTQTAAGLVLTRVAAQTGADAGLCRREIVAKFIYGNTPDFFYLHFGV